MMVTLMVMLARIPMFSLAGHPYLVAWPGSAPADLASITFDIAEGSTGSSAINFTSSSNAAGFAFAGQNHEVGYYLVKRRLLHRN
jgi:hypothetical protein